MSSAAPPHHARIVHHHPAVHLSILSQNLYGAYDSDPERRAQAFASSLEQLLPDVVGLQEVRRFGLAPLLASKTLRHAYPQLVQVEAELAGQPANAEPQWTLVLTRASAKMRMMHRRRYTGIGGWRGMDVVFANVSGRAVSFASLHLSAFDCPAAAAADESGASATTTTARGSRSPAAPTEEEVTAIEEVRNASITACPGGPARVTDLRAAFDVLAREAGPNAVLMGDWNFGSREDLFGLELAELRRRPEWRDAWREAGLHNASSAAAADPLGYTWDNRRNPLNKRDGNKRNGRLNFPTERIDRVLLRGGLRARTARLAHDTPLPPSIGPRAALAASAFVSETGIAPMSEPPLFVSDHFGVYVEASLLEHASAHRQLRGIMTLRPRAPAIEGGR